MADFDLLKTTTPFFSLFVYISVSMMGVGGRKHMDFNLKFHTAETQLQSGTA